MTRTVTVSLAASCGLLLAAGVVRADPQDDYDEGYQNDYGYENDRGSWYDYGLQSGIGIGITVGGGVGGFTDPQMRHALTGDVTGLWDAHLSIGTHAPLALELNYTGEAGDLQTLSRHANGTLVGTTADADLRLNFAPHELVTPYIFGGIGWQRYDVTGATLATADTGIRDREDNLEFPMGAGLSFRSESGWMFDVRGTFHVVSSSQLITNPRTGSTADAHWWAASGLVGYEF